MAGWNPNPYVKPKEESIFDKLRRQQQGPQQVMEVLAKRRWVTVDEAEIHYISARLGHLEKEGFKFYHAGPWSEWPEDYLYSVLAHDISLQMLRETQLWEADFKHPGRVMKTNMPEMSEAQKQKGMLREKAFQEYLARRTGAVIADAMHVTPTELAANMKLAKGMTDFFSEQTEYEKKMESVRQFHQAMSRKDSSKENGNQG